MRLLQLECLANQTQVRKHFQHCLSRSSWSQIGQKKNDLDADDAPVSPLSTDIDGPMVKATHTLKLGVLQLKLKGPTKQKGNKGPHSKHASTSDWHLQNKRTVQNKGSHAMVQSKDRHPQASRDQCIPHGSRGETKDNHGPLLGYSGSHSM